MHKLKIIGSLIIVMLVSSCSKFGLYTLNSIARQRGHYKVTTDIPYAALSRNKLDVYVPKGNIKNASVLVFFHGGNWSFGSKNDYVFLAEAFTSRGIIVVIANYRLYPKVLFPAFIEDGAKVLAWTHTNIGNYGGNPNRIFVMGHSAGGQIAAMLTLNQKYLKAVGGQKKWIRGMIGLAGPYDFLPLKEEYLKTMFGPPENFPESQPINFVDGKAPRMLLLHGKKDTTVRIKNAINLSAKVKKKGGRVKTIYYEKIGHIGIISRLSSALRSDTKILEDIITFIQR